MSSTKLIQVSHSFSHLVKSLPVSLCDWLQLCLHFPDSPVCAYSCCLLLSVLRASVPRPQWFPELSVFRSLFRLCVFAFLERLQTAGMNVSPFFEFCFPESAFGSHRLCCYFKRAGWKLLKWLFNEFILTQGVFIRVTKTRHLSVCVELAALRCLLE